MPGLGFVLSSCELCELCEHNNTYSPDVNTFLLTYLTLLTFNKIRGVFIVFYDNYIRLCNSVNKSPSAVALEIGIAKPTVNRWKHGSRPTDATLGKIARYFGVSTDELLEKEHKKTPTLQQGERKYTTEEIMEALDKADDSLREAVLLLLKLK